VQRSDFHAEQGRIAAEAHWPDSQFVAFAVQPIFELGEFRLGAGVFQRAEKLLLALGVGGAAIPADGDPQDARRAAEALRPVDGIQHHAADAFEIAARVEFGIGQFVLGADISQPPPLSSRRTSIPSFSHS